MIRGIREAQIISDYEHLQECRQWRKKIPVLKFDTKWNVRIFPPFDGAITRFTISYNNKHISVYLDGYSELGYVVDENEEPIPYWEYFDGTECYRYWLGEEDKMMEDIRKFLNEDISR